MNRLGLIERADHIPLPEQKDPDLEPSLKEGQFYKVESNTLVWTAPYSETGKPAVFKMYRNRGAISWQREKAFAFRVEREFLACSYLEGHGIPTTPPIGWFYGKNAEHGRYEVLCMVHLAGAKPIYSHAGDKPDLESKGLYEDLYHQLRRMHAAGFYHGRMDLRNALAVPDAQNSSHVVIMDAPQAMVFGKDISNTRMARNDIIQVSTKVYKRFGAERLRELLGLYGLHGASATDMLRRVERGAGSKHARNWMRFEFGCRMRWAALRRGKSTWNGRPKPSPSE